MGNLRRYALSDSVRTPGLSLAESYNSRATRYRR